MSEVVYHCSVCGKESRVKEAEPVPFCCHKEMEPLPYCTKATTAEMARSADPDEPCYDGTGRRKPD
ncbi:MAG: hypothetical protein A2W03_11875 [Candidatus Aminicenantes bacterium RBG_16_63_16]|nr:MAG: hypothetical protein A2W03_11875 [Candidatus Aminicenantes bacterium RBG_16_63_16]